MASRISERYSGRREFGANLPPFSLQIVQAQELDNSTM